MIYKYNFRFNAKHNTSPTLNPKSSHIHTFEITCYVEQNSYSYDFVEIQIKNYLLTFKGQYLNELFTNLPTIENIAEKFYFEINQLAQDFKLLRLELSDKPIQTYIIGEELE